MRQVEHRANTRFQGFTLVELMIVVAIVAVLAAITVPSFLDFVQKNKVKMAAEDIYGLVLQAKSETPVRDQDLSVSISTSTGWCVGVGTFSGCDCSNDTSCVLKVASVDVTQVVADDEHPDVTVSTADFGGSGPTFQLPRMGVNDGGTIQVSSGDWQLNIVVSDQGRIRVCNPNSNTIPGYEGC